MNKRTKFDRKWPDAREIADSIVHGAATTEGTMAAFPACFPGVTTMVPADECRIQAMDVAHGGIVYAGTGGWQCHLLVGMFHGITGMVFDMGAVEGANECAGICCGTKRFVAAVNGPGGARLVAGDLQQLPFDLIQEWHISRSPYRYLDTPALKPGEQFVHAIADTDRRTMIAATQHRLLSVDLESLDVRVVGELPCTARLACGSAGSVLGRDAGDTLWRFETRTAKLERKAMGLPKGGDWSAAPLMWARDLQNGTLYTVDAAGAVFSYDPRHGFSASLGRIPLAPVGAMAVTTDGRLYVSAGEGMARMFCYEPASGAVRDLGVAVSVLQRRRYGYRFGDAVVGRDGEIVFGENDDGGHIWLYFPRIMGPAQGESRASNH